MMYENTADMEEEYETMMGVMNVAAVSYVQRVDPQGYETVVAVNTLKVDKLQ